MNDESKNIKKDHPLSYKGILDTYGWEEIKKSKPFIFSIFFSFLICFFCFFSKVRVYDLLIITVERYSSFFPDLLGFNLGGYALIIGFGNQAFVEAISRKSSNGKYSFFQKTSGVFAFTLILQSFAFLLSFIVSIFLDLELYTLNTSFNYFVNMTCFCLLTFLGLWAIFIIPELVANVFTFGQMNHFFIRSKKK